MPARVVWFAECRAGARISATKGLSLGVVCLLESRLRGRRREKREVGILPYTARARGMFGGECRAAGRHSGESLQVWVHRRDKVPEIARELRVCAIRCSEGL